MLRIAHKMPEDNIPCDFLLPLLLSKEKLGNYCLFIPNETCGVRNVCMKIRTCKNHVLTPLIALKVANVSNFTLVP